MTRVCLVGSPDVTLQYELLSRETAREALSTYDIREPFENTVGVETVSLGAAVALLNDLDWYLVRFVDEAMVLEPSVTDSEWLSRDLAAAIRDGDVDPNESDRYCKVYGLEPVGPSSDDPRPGDGAPPSDGPDGAGAPDESAGVTPREQSEKPPERGPEEPDPRDETDETEVQYRLVEPMFVTRTGDGLPSYDLRDLEETLVERLTESEFGA